MTCQPKHAATRVAEETGPPPGGQRTLPLSREDRIELIRKLGSAPIPGLSRLKRKRYFALLEAIENNTGRDDCRPSKEKLAAILDVAVCTLVRLVSEMAARGLVSRKMVKSAEGRIVSEVRINWDVVRWHGETRFVPAPTDSIGDTLFVHDRGGDGDTPFVHAPPGPFEESGDAVDQDATARENSASRRGAIAPRREAISRLSFKETTEGSFSHSSPLREVFNKDPIRQPIQPLRSSSPTDEERARSGLDELPDGFAPSGKAPPHVWLKESDLTDPAAVARWALMAIERSWKKDFETDFAFMFWTFTAAASAYRRGERRGGTVKSPVGCFVSLVKNRFLPKGRAAASNADEDWARAAMRRFEANGAGMNH